MTHTALLAPRHWQSTGSLDAPATPTSPPTAPTLEQESSVTIHCAGIDFVARHSMAVIFLRRALELVAAGDSGTVPLLHSGGVDLLLITPTTAVACRFNGWTLTDIHSLRGHTAVLTSSSGSRTV